MTEENNYNKFTILGETGSGKTCYLLGMYSEMSMGIAGYTMTAKDADDDRTLALRYDMLSDTSRGNNRFPDPSDNVQKYEFDLQYAYESILPFEWVDYPGGFLDAKQKDVDSDRYKQVEKSISESSVLFICIDGENLIGSDKRNKINKVRNKCTRNIGPYLAKFKGHLPPIAMVVTKNDLCEKDTSSEELKEIIEAAFEALFKRDDVFVAVIRVSLGDNLKDNNYSGELNPQNIHLPILMGINFALINKLEAGKKLIENINSRISEAERKRNDEQDSFFLWRDDDYIRDMNERIAEYRQELEKTFSLAKYFVKSMNRVNRDLETINMIFTNGSWQDRRKIRIMWEERQRVADYFDSRIGNAAFLSAMSASSIFSLLGWRD